MMVPDCSARESTGRRLLTESAALDKAMYDAVARTPSPTLDIAATRLARVYNYSMLSIAIAAVLATFGRTRGRRAAARGLTAIGTTSLVANLIAKPLFRRHRPARTAQPGRDARMPESRSFPSGHTASAFAFAAAATRDVPGLALPLYALATVVGYSRVHLGVHYPSDVMGGAVLGLSVGTVVRQVPLMVGRFSAA